MNTRDIPFSIRRVRRTDLPQWLSMRRSLWPGCPLKKHQKEMAAILGDTKDQPVWVAAVRQGMLAGFLEGSVRNYADGAGRQDVGYLEGLYVRPAFRKLGIGRALIQAAEEWARKRGFGHMGSDTWVGNRSSHQAHLAMGYREVGRDVHYIKKIGPFAPMLRKARK